MSRCLICDASKVATLDPEAGVAFTLLVGCVGTESRLGGLESIKSTMCSRHRGGWALTVMRGASIAETVAESFPEQPPGEEKTP